MKATGALTLSGLQAGTSSHAPAQRLTARGHGFRPRATQRSGALAAPDEVGEARTDLALFHGRGCAGAVLEDGIVRPAGGVWVQGARMETRRPAECVPGSFSCAAAVAGRRRLVRIPLRTSQAGPSPRAFREWQDARLEEVEPMNRQQDSTSAVRGGRVPAEVAVVLAILSFLVLFVVFRAI